MLGSRAITPEQLERVYADLRRRVDLDDVDLAIHVWPQMWSNTRLGFRGVGGNAMTNAVTIVAVVGAFDAYVYFNDRPAYLCDAEELLTRARQHRRPAAPAVVDAMHSMALRAEELSPATTPEETDGR